MTSSLSVIFRFFLQPFDENDNQIGSSGWFFYDSEILSAAWLRGQRRRFYDNPDRMIWLQPAP